MAALENTSAPGARRVAPATIASWARAFVALLAIGELWVLRARFSTDALELADAWWAPLVRMLRFQIPWGACVLGAVTLFGGKTLRAELVALARAGAEHTSAVTACFAHVLVLTALFALTSLLLESAPARPAPDSAVVAWMAAAAASVFTLASIAFPPRALATSLRKLGARIAVGVVLGTAAWSAGSWVLAEWPLSEPLGRATLRASHFLIGMFTSERVFDESEFILGTPDFPVHVTRYCSGYEGISLFVAFFAFFLATHRDRLRFPSALVLLPAGVVLVWALNAVRIALLVGVGTAISPDVAIEGFHVYAGWPFVALAALTIVLVATRVPFFAAPAAARVAEVAGAASEPKAPNLTAAFLGPLLAVVATAMLCGALTSTPEALLPVRAAAGAIVLLAFRKRYARPAARAASDSSPTSDPSPIPVASPTSLARAIGPRFAPIVWGLACAALWLAIASMKSAALPDRDPFTWQAGVGAGWIALWWCARAIGYVLVTPMCEELAFRGYLLRRVAAHEFETVDARTVPIRACAISALAFGLAHDAWIAGLAAGAVYALVYRWRGRLSDAVLCHATTNAALASFAASTGHWWAWS